jgi:hypothetical protein
MNFRDVQQTQSPVSQRQAVSHQEGSGRKTPISPLADVEYANRLGVEYFSLMADCGQGVLKPRTLTDKAKPR